MDEQGALGVDHRLPVDQRLDPTGVRFDVDEAIRGVPREPAGGIPAKGPAGGGEAHRAERVSDMVRG